MDDIRAAIKAKIAAVADIGVVNDYERYSKNQSELQAQYVATIAGSKQLRGWNIRRKTTKETSPATGSYAVTHAWDLRGYMALDDSAESEKTFDGLIEALRDAFRTDENLGGLISSTVIEDAAGVQVIESVPVLFAGVLCHSARLRLFTRHHQ
ncbi:MAG: hypothetical protein IH603_00015 [Burkholderia vietnamiensis]|nr:hypothetical protein [Burkholderia vietnamiensis]